MTRVPFRIGIEPDGRLSILTPDGVSISDEPLPAEPESLKRLAEMVNVDLELTGHWCGDDCGHD